MDEKYYQVRRKDHPIANGVVLKVHGDDLETFAGDPEPKDYCCSLDERGNLVTGKDYYSKEISPKEASQLRESHLNWRMLQGWAGTDSDPESVLANTPGLKGLSRGN